MLSKLTTDEFKELSDGCVIFCIVVANGNKPSLERMVKTVSYHMVASHKVNADGKTSEICTLGMTAGGYAKVDCFDKRDLADNGNKILLNCKPLLVGDIRKSGNFVYR